MIGPPFGSRTSPPTPGELARRLERERKARRQAEEIAESATSELYAALQELRLANADLDRRVEQRTQELEEAYRELELFSFSISHDLRAPLRGIEGFSHVLLEDYSGQLDGDGRRYLERISAAADQMNRLIDAMLGLARVARVTLDMQVVDLSAVARDVAAGLSQAEPERVVDFVLADGVGVRGDPALLQAALQNLLHNAWKFTSRQPRARIEFGSLSEGKKAVYYVRDDGAGFDQAFAEKLFQPFGRLHSTAEFEGHGIGLATVQRILAKHGGQIWAEGEAQKGATFYFSLGESEPTGGTEP